MSWFKNLFKKKPKRLPARDHLGRFLADEKGNPLFTDSPKEEIEKAIKAVKKRDEAIIKKLRTRTIATTETKTKTCGCDISIKKCACSPKKPTATKPVAKPKPETKKK